MSKKQLRKQRVKQRGQRCLYWSLNSTGGIICTTQHDRSATRFPPGSWSISPRPILPAVPSLCRLPPERFTGRVSPAWRSTWSGDGGWQIYRSSGRRRVTVGKVPQRAVARARHVVSCWSMRATHHSRVVGRAMSLHPINAVASRLDQRPEIVTSTSGERRRYANVAAYFVGDSWTLELL